MKKYKVEFSQAIQYVIDVLAKNEQEAKDKAIEKWGKIDGTEHYYQVGDETLEVINVYDVSGTDDPFNP